MPEEQDTMTTYEPTEKEKLVVQDIFNKFRLAADLRNRNYAYFDNSDLISYIEDSVIRFITNVDNRENIEDWQARVHDPFTRNKVKAILGKIFSVLPAVDIMGRGSEDYIKGSLLTSLYEYSEEIDDYEDFMINFLLEAIVKGTAIGYEDVQVKSRKIRNVTGANDKIKVNTITEKKTVLNARIVPLEDFYPSNIGVRSIKQMPFCFWRSTYEESRFRALFGQYGRSALVKAKVHTEAEDERPFFVDYISDDVLEGHVEVIRYFDRERDQLIIVANGVWINPIMSGNRMIESPLPHNHKELPFFDVKFDLFGADFFYGKSLPDILKSMQDVLNVLTNMLLDQSFLSVWAPMLVAGVDDIEDDYLRPGRRIPVDTQGLPLNQSFMKLDPGTPSGWHQFILDYTRKIMEQSSVDQVSSGQAGVGERTTAQEIRVAAENINSILGLFGSMIKTAIKRKASLRVKNIMQFWTSSKTPFVQVLTPKSVQEFNQAFNTFKIENTVLTGGERGTKIIEMYQNKKQMPDINKLKARELVDGLAANKKIEIIAVDSTYLRNVDTDIKLVPNVKKEASKEMIQGLQLEKVRVYQTFFPDLVDRKELAAETMEKMGDDPGKMLLALSTGEQPQPTQESDKGTPAVPTQNLANNLGRSARGGESADLQRMAQQMLG